MSDSDPSAQQAFRTASGAGPACADAKRKARPHEWTPARMAAFLEALGETQSVSRAARSVGMGRQSAYKLKKRMAGKPFAAEWDEALAALTLTGPLAPFAGPRACPFCGASPRWAGRSPIGERR